MPIEHDIRDHTAVYQFNRGTDFTQIHRISAIVDRQFDVYDMIENVWHADHECDGDDCCDQPSLYGPESQRVLAGVGWVYALCDWDGMVLYIGQTKSRLPKRMAEHQRTYWTGPMWRRARKLKHDVDLVVAWNVGDSCRRLEHAAILALQPVLNTADVS